MSDFSLTNKVVQHNNLIQAINKLDRTTFKVFEMAISCIDTKNPKQEVYLNKQDIFAFFDTKSTAKYTLFREHMKRLGQQGIMIQLPERKKEGFINVTSQVLWGTDDKDKEVMIKFNQDIMPYLIDLKKNFTQYQITEIKDLSSKYSLILFKWLKMKLNSYQANPTISLNELRELTDTTNDYKEMTNFTRKVLNVATKEINASTTLKVSYEKIARQGRKITDIQWHIEEKDTSKAIDVDVYLAQNPYEELLASFSMEWNRGLTEAEKTMISVWHEVYGYDLIIEALRTAAQIGTTSPHYIAKWLKANHTGLNSTDKQLSLDDIQEEI